MEKRKNSYHVAGTTYIIHKMNLQVLKTFKHKSNFVKSIPQPLEKENVTKKFSMIFLFAIETNLVVFFLNCKAAEFKCQN
jgi:hypothetical protein